MHLRVPQLSWHSKQESIGLPDCALECFKIAEPDASRWGCSGSGYTCLCDISWFFADYKNCVRKSCSAVDILAADVRIQSHCDVLNKRDLSSSSSFTQAATVPVGTPTSTLQIATLTASTPIVTVRPSAISSTQATAGGATATSTSTSAATSSTQASSGLSQSAKIGIGLGVPLGVIVLALLGYALYWFGKKKGKSRGNDTGLNKSDTEKKDPIDAGAMNHIIEGGELHGQHIVHHPKELAGSPGPVRRELP